jgi:hypothetical protein
MNPETQTPKPRKRAAAKSASRQDDQKVKLTLYVPADLAKRFVVSDRAKGQEEASELPLP